MTTDASETMKGEELKRLGFLFEYGALAADLSAKYYDLVKKQTPTALSHGIETLEGAIKAYGMPIVTKVQDVAPKVITEADKRVDGVVEGVSSVYTKYTNGRTSRRLRRRGGVPEADRAAPRGYQDQGLPGIRGECPRNRKPPPPRSATTTKKKKKDH